MSEVWTIRRVLDWSVDDLRQRGSDSPRLDAELMLGQVLGMNRIALIVDANRPLSKEELAEYKELHRRRRAGEPIAYLRGVREFYGRDFRVDRRVLVPRPDTETLVEVGLRRTSKRSLYARVLDLCTGSGCVAITLGCERPTTRVLATDLSTDALVVARDNATRLGAVNVGFCASDLFDSIPKHLRFELITANPPYIEEAEIPTLQRDIVNFEPHLALSGGADGLDLVRRIITDAPHFLVGGGVLAMEIGAGQAPRVRELFVEAGFTEVEAQRDYGGHERVVSGVWARG